MSVEAKAAGGNRSAWLVPMLAAAPTDDPRPIVSGPPSRLCRTRMCRVAGAIHLSNPAQTASHPLIDSPIIRVTSSSTSEFVDAPNGIREKRIPIVVFKDDMKAC